MPLDPLTLFGQDPLRRTGFIDDDENATSTLLQPLYVQQEVIGGDDPPDKKRKLTLKEQRQLEAVLGIMELRNPDDEGRYAKLETPLFYDLISGPLASFKQLPASTTGGLRPAVTTLQVLGGAIGRLFHMFGINENEEIIPLLNDKGEPPKSTPNKYNTLDVTEHTTVLSESAYNALPKEVQLARTIKRLTAQAARFSSAPFNKDAAWTPEGAIYKGQIAPPINKAEAYADMIGYNLIGPLLPSLALYPLFAAGATLTGASAVGAAAITKAAPLLARAGGSSGPAAAAALTKAAPFLGQSLAAEGALGVGFGAQYAISEGMETEKDWAEIAGNAVLHSAIGGLAGSVLALPFRVGSLREAGRVARGLDDMISAGRVSLDVGEEVISGAESYVFRGINERSGKQMWQRWNKETKRYNFSKAPAPEAVQEHLVSKGITNFSRDEITDWGLMGKSQYGEDIKAGILDPDSKITNPIDMVDPAKVAKTRLFNHQVTLEEVDYYHGAAVRQLLHDPPELVDAKIEMFKILANRAKMDNNSEMAAIYYGRGRALERLRSEGIGSLEGRSNTPAQLDFIEPFDVEDFVLKQFWDSGALDDDVVIGAIRSNAESAVKSQPGNPLNIGRKPVLRAIDRYNTSGYKVFRDEALKARLKKGTDTYSSINSRGVKKGVTKVIDKDGNIGTIIDSPNAGVARMKLSSGKTKVVNLSDVDLVPPTGKFAQLTDGSVGYVQQRDLKKGTIKIRSSNGNVKEVPFSEVVLTGDNGYNNIQIKKVYEAERKATRIEAVRNKKSKAGPVKPRTVVNKDTGQTETVVAEGVEEIITQTKSGTRRTRNKKAAKTSPAGSKTAAAQAGEPIDQPTIFVFEPGTKPQPGRHVNFMRMSDEDYNAAAQIYMQTGDINGFFAYPDTPATIFPSSHEAGTRLIAIDRKGGAKTAKLSKNAKDAMAALSSPEAADNLTKSQYHSQLGIEQRALENARIYEVPDELGAKLVDWDTFTAMSKKDKTTYLNKVLDMSFDTNEATSAARKVVRKTKKAVQDAENTGKGGKRDRARKEHEDASAELAASIVDEELELVDAAIEAATADLRATGTRTSAERLMALAEGGDVADQALKDLFRSMPDSQPGSMHGDHIQVIDHIETPAVKARIRKFKQKVPLHDREARAATGYDPEEAARNAARAKQIDSEIAKQNRLHSVRAITEDMYNSRVAKLRDERATLEEPSRLEGAFEEADFYEIRIVDQTNGRQIGGVSVIGMNTATRTVEVPMVPAALDLSTLPVGVRLDKPPIFYTSAGRKVQVESLRPTNATTKRDQLAKQIDQYEDRLASDYVFTRRVSQKRGEAKSLDDALERGPEKVVTEELTPEEVQDGLAKLIDRYNNTTVDLTAEVRDARTGAIIRRVGDKGTRAEPGLVVEADGTVQSEVVGNLFDEVNPDLKTEWRRQDLMDQMGAERAAAEQAGAPPEELVAIAKRYEARIERAGVDAVEGESLLQTADPAMMHRPDPITPAEFAELEAASKKIIAGEAGELTTAPIEYRMRLTEEEVLDEVIRNLNGFQRQDKLAFTGAELHHNELPNLYATIYRDQKDGTHLLEFWKRSRRPLSDKITVGQHTDGGEMDNVTNLRFNSREEAEAVANARGFETASTSQEPTPLNESLDTFIGERLAAEAKLATSIPEGTSIRQALGDWDFNTHTSKPGISAKQLASKEYTAQQIMGFKARATVARKALSRELAKANLSHERKQAIMFGAHGEARQAMPHRVVPKWEIPSRSFGAFSLDELPPVGRIDWTDAAKINELEGTLTLAHNYFHGKNNGWIPQELRNYMIRFADGFWEYRGEAPWNSTIRKRIGAFTPEDLRKQAGYSKGQDAVGIDQSGGGTDVHTGEPLEGYNAGVDIGAENELATMAYADLDAVDDLSLMPGVMIGFKPDKFAAADFLEGFKTYNDLNDALIRRSPDWAVLDPALDPTDLTTSLNNSVILEFEVNGRRTLGKLISHDLTNSKVKVMDGNRKLHELAVSETDRIYSSDRRLDYINMANNDMGRPGIFNTSRMVGESPLDPNMGITLGLEPNTIKMRVMQYGERIFRTGSEELGEPLVQWDPKTKSIIGRPSDINHAVEYFTRASELGLHKEALEMVPGPMRTALKQVVYDNTMEEWGWSGLGHLVGKVKSGKADAIFLRELGKWAESHGIKSSNPVEQAEGLAKMGAIDPDLANQILAVNHEAGFFSFWGGAVDVDRLSVSKGPRRFSEMNYLQRFYTSTLTAARRHPGVEMYVHLLNNTTQREGANLEIGQAVFQNLEEYYAGPRNITRFVKGATRRVTPGVEDLKKEVSRKLSDVRDLVEEFPTWEAATAANADLDPSYQYGFNTIKDFLTSALDRVKLHLMRYGTDWVTFDPKNPAHTEYVMKHLNMTLADMPEGFVIPDQWKTPPLKPHTTDIKVPGDVPVPSKRIPKQEANRFIELQRQYKTLDEVPTALRGEMSQWMLDEWNHWQGFGMTNYWPYVHRGQFLIETLDPTSGNWSMVASARSAHEAFRGVQEIRLRGLAGEGTDVRWRQHVPSTDDLDSKLVSREQWTKMSEFLQKETELPSTKVGDLLHKGGFHTPPPHTTLVHGKKRIGLRSILENPLKDLEVYNARIVRNEYLMDIDEAWSWFVANQGAMSKAYGVPDILQTRFSDGKIRTRSGELANFMQDLHAAARGDEGPTDIAVNHFVTVTEFLRRLPPRLLKRLTANLDEHGMPIGEGWNKVMPDRWNVDWDGDPEIIAAWNNFNIYEKPFQGRKLAGSITALQGAIKLGVTPGAAAVNLSQWYGNVYGYLGPKWAMRGMSEFRRHWAYNYGSAFSKMAKASIYKGKGLSAAMSAEMEEVMAATGVKFQTNVMTQQAGIPGLQTLRRPELLEHGTAANVQYLSMALFEGAERMNRGATAWSAYIKAKAPKTEGGFGMSKEAALKYSSTAVEETQFLYFDQALPRMLRGPLAKIFAQFKTYAYGQARFQKNMAVNSVTGRDMARTDAFRALAWNSAVMTALGGTAYWTLHPALAPLTAVGSMLGVPNLGQKLLGFDPDEAAADNFVRRKNGGNTLIREVAQYGLPALANMNFSRRIGITAADFDLRNASSFFGGPHGSSLIQFGKFMAPRVGLGRDRGEIAATAGGAWLASTWAAAKSGRGAPYAAMAGAVASMMLYNRMAKDPLPDISNDPEFRKFTLTVMPTIIQDAQRTYALVADHGQYEDVYGRPVPIPPYARTVTEGLTTMFGSVSPGATNMLAYENFYRSKDIVRRGRRGIYLDQIAEAAANDDMPSYLYWKARADEEGIRFDESTMSRAIQSRTDWRMNSVMEQVMQETLTAESMNDYRE